MPRSESFFGVDTSAGNSVSAEQLTVALAQMTSNDDFEANLQQMENLIAEIPADAGVRLVVFPENSLYLRLTEGERIVGLELNDPALARLCDLAKKRSLHLHFTTPVRVKGSVANASVWVTDQGSIRAVYEKMHLFDIELTNGPSVRESDAFRAGSEPVVIEIDGWKIGESICYDLRFAELYSIYAREEVDLILIPSAFLTRTGEAHWDLLVRARAIESQCFVLAPAQSGTHRSARSERTRETYGNSLAVDPWGRVMAQLSESGPAIAIVSLRRSEALEVRRQIPMRAHRRLPIAR